MNLLRFCKTFFSVCAVCVTAAFCSGEVTVPSGVFTLGNSSGSVDETPSRRVYISSFVIDAYEVTLGSYDSCVARGICTPPHFSNGKCLMLTSGNYTSVVVPPQYRLKNYPVTCVSWQQAKAYCAYRKKSLPTEAQWEYAALGGKNKRYAWGDAPPSAAVCAQPHNRHPAVCGSYSPNAYGIYDMTGNVWEWTNDRYLYNFYESASDTNPNGPTVGRYRTIRGGGWYSDAQQQRIKKRAFFTPEFGEVSIGFRCVKE